MFNNPEPLERITPDLLVKFAYMQLSPSQSTSLGIYLQSSACWLPFSWYYQEDKFDTQEVKQRNRQVFK